MISFLLDLLMCVLWFAVVCLGGCSRLSWRRMCSQSTALKRGSIRVSQVRWVDSVLQVTSVSLISPCSYMTSRKKGVTVFNQNCGIVKSPCSISSHHMYFDALWFGAHFLAIIRSYWRTVPFTMTQCQSSSLRFSPLQSLTFMKIGYFLDISFD